LTLLIFGDKNKARSPGNPDKAKPSVRRGQKAADLIEDGRATEGKTSGMFGFFLSEWG
jgi:hypothetical protein